MVQGDASELIARVEIGRNQASEMIEKQLAKGF